MEQERIGLRPAANPVSTFTTPSVSYNDSGAGEMAQLAQALKGFNSTFDSVMSRRMGAEIEGLQRLAVQDAAKQRIESKQALKAAVDSGVLPESMNPWYMTALRQEVARKEASTTVRNVYNEYLNDPIAHSDDLEQVSQFFDERLGSLLEGRDAWEAEVLIPTLQQSKQSILNQHVSRRTQEREVEREVSFTTTVREIIDQYDFDLSAGLDTNDPAANAKLSELKSAVQSEVNRAGQTVHWPKVNQWVSQAAAEAALAKRDVNVARRFLEGITTRDGATLASTSDNRAMLDRLGRQIDDLIYTDANREEHLNRMKRDKESRDLVSAAKQKERETGVPWFVARLSREDLAKVSPEAEAEFTRLQVQQAGQLQSQKSMDRKQGAEPLLGGIVRNKLAGTITPDQEATTLDALAALGAFEDIQQYQQFKYNLESGQQNDLWGNTSYETKAQLLKAAYDGTLSAESVLVMANNRQISERDFNEFMARAYEARSNRGDEPVKQMLGSMDSLITAGLNRNGEYENINELLVLPATREKIVAASLAFDAAARELKQREDWGTKTTEQQLKELKSLRDTVSKTYGGYSEDELLTASKQPVVSATEPEIKLGDAPAPDVVGSLVQKVDAQLSPLTDDRKDLLKAIRSRLGGEAYTPSTGWKWSQYDAIEQLLQHRSDWTDTSGEMFDKAAVQVPTGGSIVDLAGNRKDLTRTAYMKPQEVEIKRWDQAMAAAKTLTSTLEAEKADQTVDRILTTFKQTNEISSPDRAKLFELMSMKEQLLAIRRNAGYTAREVKQMGSNAWKHVPMFANELDIERNGPKSAAALGLSEQQAVEMVVAQRALIRELRKANKEGKY